MMHRVGLVILAVILGSASLAWADTTFVAAGAVSGVWTPDGNPYFVHQGDITVMDGSSLTVMPGVEVLFTGNYKLIVAGLLNAEGTEADSIIFTRAYPTEESKWRGFRFDQADEGCTLEYCRIEYAKGTGPYPDVRGGGVWIESCSVLIRNCRIANNYCHNENLNGSGGGIFVNSSTNTIIEYCHIVQNTGDNGGGVCVGQNCFTTIRHNLIEANWTYSSAGGIYVSANAESEIHDNVIVGNHANGIFGGGGINLWSATWMYGTFSYVYNNLIVDNTASSSGGGIYHRYESSILYNNTIVDNQAVQGGGIYVLTFPDLPPVIYNSIVWGNSAPTGSQIYLDPLVGSTANVSYCDVQGGWPGAGNFSDDPLFVTGPQGEYYLSQIAAGQASQSPCVDVGDPSSALVGGTTRTDEVPDEGVVDLGYHYPVEVTVAMNVILTPHNPPIQIPATGGTFDFDILIENLESAPVTCDIWTEAILPNGQPYPIILRSDVTIPGGGSLLRTLTQNVPPGAPAGSYAYNAYVGDHPDLVYAEDSFPFEKLGAADASNPNLSWTLSGWDETETLIGVGPNKFTLHDAHPNPFNPSTTISFSLPEASKVNLSVFDVSGRLVAQLVDGYRQEGTHDVTFDGSNLASGIYVYHLETSNFSTSRKIVLIK
jgi:parallel beta-helix repeat protein